MLLVIVILLISNTVADDVYIFVIGQYDPDLSCHCPANCRLLCSVSLPLLVLYYICYPDVYKHAETVL